MSSAFASHNDNRPETLAMHALVPTIPMNCSHSHPAMEQLLRLSRSGDREHKMRNVLFYHDRMDLWALVRRTEKASDFYHWAVENIGRAVTHTPRLLELWASRRPRVSKGFVLNVGYGLDGVEGLKAQDRLDVLNGNIIAKAPAVGALLCQALLADPEQVISLSPGWVGAEHSPLRAKMLELGWRPAMLATMCAYHAEHGNPKAWIDQFAYPYSLWALHHQLHGERRWDIQDPRGWAAEWVMRIAPNASPLDLACTQAILDGSSMEVAYTLPKRHGTDAAREEETEELLRLVRMYMGLNMHQELMDHLAEQSLRPTPNGLVESLGAYKMDSMALPSL